MTRVRIPPTLREEVGGAREVPAEGDTVRLLSTGAYTTCYSTVGFNGFPPLKSYVI